MFDIGWSEMAVIALLTLIVIGPKELPRVLRTVGQWVRKAQSLAREFQRGLDDMAREADLEDAKKLLDSGRSLANPKKMVMDTIDPTGSVEQEARDLQSSMSVETPAGGAGAPAKKAAPDAKPDAKLGAKPGATPDSTADAAAEAPGQVGGPAGGPVGSSVGSPAGSNGEARPAKPAAQATVVKHPVKVAPPHSVTPPAEPGADTKTKTAEPEPAEPDGSQKSA